MRKLDFSIRKKKEGPEKPRLAQVVQIVLVNLEAGCTLEEALKNALGEPKKAETAVKDMELFAAELNDKEFYRFLRLVRQYQQNGSKSTLSALEKFGGEMYINKMENIKKTAEGASVKLTLLLMLSLFSIILVVMTPVVMMLKSI